VERQYGDSLVAEGDWPVCWESYFSTPHRNGFFARRSATEMFIGRAGRGSGRASSLHKEGAEFFLSYYFILMERMISLKRGGEERDPAIGRKKRKVLGAEKTSRTKGSEDAEPELPYAMTVRPGYV